MTESASPSTSTATVDARAARRPWLFHPVVDVAVGCGLLALPLALLADFASARAASLSLVVVAALSIVVNGPHFAATVVRAWGLGDRHRRLLLIASGVAVVVVIAAHVRPALLPWLFTAWLSFSPWHYATQNHGVGLVLLARDTDVVAAIPSTGERRALKLAHALMAAAAIVATHVGAREPLLLRVGISPAVAVPFAIGCVVVGALLTLGVLRRLRRRGAGRRGLLLVAALVSTSLVWFAVPAVLARGGALVYAAGVVALLHCAQYLWITGFVQGRVAFLQQRSFDVVAWAGLLTAGGVALLTLGPWIVSRGFGYDLIISLLIVQAVVNLHHFVVDAALWKLRDPALRAPLFADPGSGAGPGHERAAAHREQVSNARALLFSVPAVTLLLVGVVDVLQLAGTRADAPVELRDRVKALNENDSRVWVQQAQDGTVIGDLDGARADLARAVDLSPWNADAQRALARLHVLAGRDDEAWARYQAMPAPIGNDGTASVLFAGVAERLGKLTEAEALARTALLQLDGSGTLDEVEARRTLGAVLLKTNKNAEARAELKRGLDDAEAALGDDPLRKGQLLELGLALADADVALSQADPALVLYERVLQGAKRANRPDAAFHALTARARVFSQRDDPVRALQGFQEALRFADEVKTDPERVARAWLDYTAILARSEAPMRIRFAGALKARAAAEQFASKGPPSADKDELLRFITEATRYVEEVLTPQDAESVRKDVNAAAADALLLTYPDANDADGAIPPALTP